MDLNEIDRNASCLPNATAYLKKEPVDARLCC